VFEFIPGKHYVKVQREREREREYSHRVTEPEAEKTLEKQKDDGFEHVMKNGLET